MILSQNTMPSRSVGVDFALDTNRINTRKALPSMNRLERWDQERVILLVISETALAECYAPKRAEKASNYIFTRDRLRAPEEYERLRKIEAVLFPGVGAKNKNKKNDVRIAFNASKYGDILITADGASNCQSGGILGNRAGLEALGIRVMTDSEAVAFVEGLIRHRDDHARRVSLATLSPLPAWVGKD